MRLCLWVVLRHVGDIAASRALQAGNQSLPRLRSPLLDRIADVVESRTKMFWAQDYIYQRVGFFLLLSPFVALVRHPDVEFWLFSSQISLKKFEDHAGILESFRWFCDENIVLGASWHLGVVAMSRGVELRGVVVTILSLQFWNTWVRWHWESPLCSCWWDNLDATQYWGGSSEVLP